VLAQLGMWWVNWGCDGSAGDVVAQLGMWRLSLGDVVSQGGCNSWVNGGS
jgi:hypothetical protein